MAKEGENRIYINNKVLGIKDCHLDDYKSLVCYSVADGQGWLGAYSILIDHTWK